MIIGCDEVNFSPSLAGDCVICAYARRPELPKARGVKDSKLLTAEQRLKLFKKLQRGTFTVVPATVNDINQIGIYKARNSAITSAINGILRKIQYSGRFPAEEMKVIIDGYFSDSWLKSFRLLSGLWVECLVNGDQKIYEISAASIVARVYADALFAGFGQFYPGYDLEKCHGSPSKKMYAKLRESGPTPYHRTNYGRHWWEKIMGNREQGK